MSSSSLEASSARHLAPARFFDSRPGGNARTAG